MGCHFLLQGIFPILGSNLHLLNWQADLLPLSQEGSPHTHTHPHPTPHTHTHRVTATMWCRHYFNFWPLLQKFKYAELCSFFCTNYRPKWPPFPHSNPNLQIHYSKEINTHTHASPKGNKSRERKRKNVFTLRPRGVHCKISGGRIRVLSP